ncbi:MAG: sulfurtransferase [Gammaproteobacteria bacterium]|nr:sulfurtransferase [Gammaproteobacteria bacterium]|tara:strand:- start:2121 stop:2543 length:423 start_codon:yes stop_codon:yes gene_type:complete
MQQYINFILDKPILFILFFLILSLIIFLEVKKYTQKFKEISPQEAVILLNNNAVLLDVREDNELSNGTIKDSKHISCSALSKNIDKIEQHKGESIIIFCKRGIRSSFAANLLIKNDFSDVYSLKGGFDAWVEDNLPIFRK